MLSVLLNSTFTGYHDDIDRFFFPGFNIEGGSDYIGFCRTSGDDEWTAI